MTQQLRQPVNRNAVVVVGSANIDEVALVQELPRPGETVMALSSSRHCGGKGSNQAIAAARLGAHVEFVGAIGVDPEGALLEATWADAGVRTTGLEHLDLIPTGKALIAVDSHAENSIVVIPGANARVTPEAVQAQAALIRHANVVVMQLEIPLDTVQRACELAEGVKVLNAAPAQVLSPALLSLIDVLVVNEAEFATVLGGDSESDAATITDTMSRPSVPPQVVVTRGGQGALVWDRDRLTTVPAPAVDVIDTTGAGDTFVGALAEALSRGSSLLDAAQWAVTAATISTQTLGATDGMPTRHQVAAALGISLPTQTSRPDANTNVQRSTL